MARQLKFYPRKAIDAAALAQQGSYGASGDILDHVLFDQLPFQATTVRPQSTFFATPQGGTYGAGTKTIAETNMSLQGQLPKSQNFIVSAWSLAFVPFIVGADTDQNTVMQAVFNIIQSSVFELHLAGREFDTQMPGSRFIPGFVASALNSAANGVRFGDVVTSGIVPLDIPVTIEGQANFSVIQRTTTAIAALLTILNTASDVLSTQNAALQVRLHGYLTRGK